MEVSRGSRYKKGPTIVLEPSSEVEIANVDYEKHDRSFFTDSHDYPERGKSSVQVQINDSARNIIFAAGSKQSALLDVTVMRPNLLSLETSMERNILTTSQVKDLLVSLEKQRLEKKNILNNLFDDRQETIVQISSHKKPLYKHAASDGVQTNIHSPRIRRHITDYDRERTKVITSSAPVSDRRERRQHGYLSDIRETVDPLFVGLKESLRNVEARITAMQINIDANQTSPESYTNYSRATRHHKVGDSVNAQHVYRTTRGSKDMKIPLTCQTKYDQPSEANKPCFCQHCGVVGLISEQQKFPIVSHTPEPKQIFKKTKQDRNRQENYSHQDKHIAYIQELAERVKILEERLDLHEERAVPKEYFKRIITKIVSHFSAKTAKLQNEIPTLRADYKRQNYPEDLQYGHFHETTQYQHDDAFYNTPFMSSKEYDKYSPTRNDSGGLSSEDNTKRKVHTVDALWKWGGEILKPGIDLKNKIMSLIEVTLSKLKSSENTSQNLTSQKEDNKKTKLEEPYKDSLSRIKNDNFQYCFTSGNGQVYSLLKRPVKEECDIFKPLEMPDFIKNKECTAHDNRRYMEFDRKFMKQSFIPRPVSTFKPQQSREEPKVNVDVAYVNPNIASWKEESSSASIRVEYGDDYSGRNNGQLIKEAEKREFLKVLSHTKDADKQRLWQSIWNQAVLNGQKKSDKVTIQIPKQQQQRNQNYQNGNGNDGDILEIEFTIGDLECMLVRDN